MQGKLQSLLIKQAELSDVPILAKNTSDLALETENITCDVDFISKNLEHSFKDPLNTFFLLATWDSTPSGSLCNTMEYNIVDCGSYAWFQSVFIPKPFRGRKIFRALFDYAKMRALDRGCLGMKLYVEKDNDHARKVYQKLGFYFPTCNIYQVDLVFGFGCEKFSKENIKKNYEKFFSQCEEACEELGGFLKLDLFPIERENISEVLKKDIDEFKILMSSRKKKSNSVPFSECLSNFVKSSYSHCFGIYTNGELIGILSAFDEFSDWRGTYMYWVYDVRVRPDFLPKSDYILARAAQMLLQCVRKRDRFRGDGMRWQIFEEDEERVLKVLKRIGFEKYGDDVMDLDFNKD